MFQGKHRPAILVFKKNYFQVKNYHMEFVGLVSKAPRQETIKLRGTGVHLKPEEFQTFQPILLLVQKKIV